MAAYLFGNTKRAIGSVNGIPVVVETEIGFPVGSKTTVNLGGKEIKFTSRTEALDYLRKLAEQETNNGKGQKT